MTDKQTDTERVWRQTHPNANKWTNALLYNSHCECITHELNLPHSLHDKIYNYPVTFLQTTDLGPVFYPVLFLRITWEFLSKLQEPELGECPVMTCLSSNMIRKNCKISSPSIISDVTPKWKVKGKTFIEIKNCLNCLWCEEELTFDILKRNIYLAELFCS